MCKDLFYFDDIEEDCRTCAEGRYLVRSAAVNDQVSGTCEPCDQGKFKDSEGQQVECMDCAADKYNPVFGSVTDAQVCQQCGCCPKRATGRVAFFQRRFTRTFTFVAVS